jgi:hypothetical protein
MKYIFSFICFTISLMAEQNSLLNTKVAASSNQKDVILIEPSKRAQDFMQAYEILKKGKSPQSIFFHISNGSVISNVLEMTSMNNGTLLLFKITTNTGAKFELIPIENLLSISQL